MICSLVLSLFDMTQARQKMAPRILMATVLVCDMRGDSHSRAVENQLARMEGMIGQDNRIADHPNVK